MEKSYIIIAHNGIEVVDNRPDADIHIWRYHQWMKEYRREHASHNNRIHNARMRAFWECNSFVSGF